MTILLIERSRESAARTRASRLSASAVILLIAVALSACGAGAGRGRTGIKNSPYTIDGFRYRPYSVEQALQYEESGIASWYGPSSFWSRKETTANGEKIGARSSSAAHRLLPLPCTIEVTNLRNGRRAVVRVNDRGPFIRDRLIDVSARTAKVLGFKDEGLAPVRIRVLRVGN